MEVIRYQLAERQRGFTYLGLLFAIALMGVALALTGVVWHAVQKREKERQLLFVGNQFRQAIEAYYKNSPGSAKQFPKELSELLKDSRQLVTRRYLRRIYPDPFTGKAEWGLVKASDDRIMGVFSLSEDDPVKKSNFRDADKEFEGKMRYTEWRFVYNAPQVPPQSVPPPAEAAKIPPQLASKLPAAQKPPVNPVEKPFNESLCDKQLANDTEVCQSNASHFGEEAGKSCAESAEVRFAECREKRTAVGLTPLKIQPDPESVLQQP